MIFSESLPLKEIGKHTGAFGFENAGDNLCFRVEYLLPAEGKTPFGIVCTIDDTADLGPESGAGAHHAGFEGDIESAVAQVLAIEAVGGSRKRLHFGMGCNVTEGFRQVMGPGNDPSIGYDHGTHGDFVLFQGFPGLGERLAHEEFVGHAAKIGELGHGGTRAQGHGGMRAQGHKGMRA